MIVKRYRGFFYVLFFYKEADHYLLNNPHNNDFNKQGR
jgi:hypothetical protein